MDRATLLIVGGGLAGAVAAASYRKAGGAESMAIISQDADLPAHRPPLSKEYLHTSHPDVYAIGDVAGFPDPIGGRLHLEHWDNALQQGRTLGQTLAGNPTPFDHVAYFFSDLFDLSLNMIGYPLDWDDIIVRGEPESGKFTTVYIRNEAVAAVLMINDDQHFDAWTALVKARRDLDGASAVLADPTIDPAAVLQTPAGS